MTSVSEPLLVDGREAFPSLAALREAHSTLLDRRRAEGDAPDLLAAIAAFIQRGSATGALLDGSDDRRAAQSLLNYWATALYRLDQDPHDATLAEFDPLLAPALPDSACPYLGLDAFDEANAERFFGRRELIDRLVERLGVQRLLAIVGPSGSGKSSVVRAGLLPALRRGALPDSAAWRCMPAFVPGSTPLENMARALRGVLPPAADDAATPRAELVRLTTLLRQNTGTLARLLGDAAAPAVMVVDQFEEIFTLCTDPDERAAFIANLLGLAQAADLPHRIVITMRSDFEAFVARAPDLQAMFERGRIQMTPLSAAELREAIDAPAAQVGLKFEAGVVDLLVQDLLGAKYSWVR